MPVIEQNIKLKFFTESHFIKSILVFMENLKCSRSLKNTENILNLMAIKAILIFCVYVLFLEIFLLIKSFYLKKKLFNIITKHLWELANITLIAK